MNIRQPGSLDSMPILTSQTQTISVKHCIVLLRGCGIQNFLFELTQFLHCAPLLKLAEVYIQLSTVDLAFM